MSYMFSMGWWGIAIAVLAAVVGILLAHFVLAIAWMWGLICLLPGYIIGMIAGHKRYWRIKAQEDEFEYPQDEIIGNTTSRYPGWRKYSV